MPRLSCARKLTWIIFGWLCLCCIGAIVLELRNCAVQQSTGKLQYVSANVESDVPSFVRSIRPVYPYSVISGGVYSARELRDSTARDPMVASHYSGFDIGHAELVRTTAPTIRYVSYRKSNQVMWTRKPVRIPKGELLLSDGVSFARARCGNRLSASPVGPAPDSGPDVDLSIPDIEAPRSNSPLAANGVPPVDIWPVAELRLVQPAMESHPTSANLYTPFRSAVEPVNVNPIETMPIIVGPGLPLPGTPAPLNPLFPVPPTRQPIVAPVPEPSTRWQVASTLAIGFVLLFVFRRAVPKTE